MGYQHVILLLWGYVQEIFYALYTLYIVFIINLFCFPQATFLQDRLLLKSLLESTLNSLHVLSSSNIILTTSLTASKRQILSHDVIDINGINTRLLKRLSERDDIGSLVELPTLDQTAGPGKDGGDWVGGGLVALLVLTVVAGDGAVGGFGLEGLSVWRNEDRGHEAERAKALGDDVGLNISIVV